MPRKKSHAIVEEIKELERRHKEEIAEIRELQRETADQMKDTDRILKDLSRSIKETNGNFNDKWGKFMESLICGDLVRLLNKRNIEVQRVQPRLIIPGPDGKEDGDFDLVVFNGDEIVVFEVKTTLTSGKLEKFLNNLKHFKQFFPEYKNKKIYGGVGYLDDYRNTSKQAKEEGLFVIKAPRGEAQVSTITNHPDFQPKEF